MDGNGAALALQLPAAGPQLGLHGLDAVTLLDAETLGVADDRGSLTQQAQHHQHRAQVGAVGKVDVRSVERGLFKHHALTGAGESCTAPPEDLQNGRIALQGLLRQAGDGHTAGHSAQHPGAAWL